MRRAVSLSAYLGEPIATETMSGVRLEVDGVSRTYRIHPDIDYGVPEPVLH